MRIRNSGLSSSVVRIVSCATFLLSFSCDDDSSSDEKVHSDDAEESPAVEKFVCEPRSSEAPTAFSDGCVDPISIPDREGKDSGFVCCADGSINREQKKTLSSFKDDDCSSDDDCNPSHICFPGTLIEKNYGNICISVSCSQNSDCKTGECGILNRMGPLCPGAPPDTRCRTEVDECRTDDTCEEGDFCGLVRTELDDGPTKYTYVWECIEAEECVE